MEYLYKEIEAEYEEIRFRNAGTWKYIPLETFHRFRSLCQTSLTYSDSEIDVFSSLCLYFAYSHNLWLIHP